MSCHALLDARLNVVALLVCLVIVGPMFASGSHGKDRTRHDFAVAHVALEMDYGSVLKIYPAAMISQQAANCYRYGMAVRDPSMTRRVLQQRIDAGVLTMTFTSPRDGGRLSRIYYDRPVDPSTFEFRKMLDKLITRYGPHDRILHRRKMEPAGRIIGFEWLRLDGSNLRVVVRHDHHTNPAAVRLSILARAPVLQSRSSGQPVLCASDH